MTVAGRHTHSGRGGYAVAVVAVAAVAVAAVLRLALDPLLGDNYPCVTFFLAFAAVAGLYRVKDGRIVQFRQFTDTAKIAGAMLAAGKGAD